MSCYTTFVTYFDFRLTVTIHTIAENSEALLTVVGIDVVSNVDVQVGVALQNVIHGHGRVRGLTRVGIHAAGAQEPRLYHTS